MPKGVSGRSLAWKWRVLLLFIGVTFMVGTLIIGQSVGHAVLAGLMSAGLTQLLLIGVGGLLFPMWYMAWRSKIVADDNQFSRGLGHLFSDAVGVDSDGVPIHPKARSRVRVIGAVNLLGAVMYVVLAAIVWRLT